MDQCTVEVGVARPVARFCAAEDRAHASRRSSHELQILASSRNRKQEHELNTLPRNISIMTASEELSYTCKRRGCSVVLSTPEKRSLRWIVGRADDRNRGELATEAPCTLELLFYLLYVSRIFCADAFFP